jgi:hypothetical protein
MIKRVYWFFAPIEKDDKFHRNYVYDNPEGNQYQGDGIEYFVADYGSETPEEANSCFHNYAADKWTRYVDCTQTNRDCLDILDDTEGGTLIQWSGDGVPFGYPLSYEDAVNRLFKVLSLFPQKFGSWGIFNNSTQRSGYQLAHRTYDGQVSKISNFPEEKVALVERVVDNVNALQQDAWRDGRKEGWDVGYVEGYDAGTNQGWTQGYERGKADWTGHGVTYELLMCFAPNEEQLICGHDDPLWLMNKAMNLVGYIGNGMNGSIRFKVQRIVDGSVEGTMVMTTENTIAFEGVS